MPELIFIRHGTTPNNVEGKFAGRTDNPLTEESYKEIKEMVRQYPYPEVEVIYRSPALRCQQTLEAVYPGRDAIILEDLHELEFGDAEGRHSQEVMSTIDPMAFFTRQLDFSFPAGETLGHLLERAEAAISRILQDAEEQKYEKIGIVTHSLLIDILLRNHVKPAMTNSELYCPNGQGYSIGASWDEWQKEQILHLQDMLPKGAPREKLEDSPYAVVYDQKEENEED